MITKSDTPRTDEKECRGDEVVSSAFVVDSTLARQLERELNESSESMRLIGEFLSLSFDRAQKRYHEEQTSGDEVSIASTRAEYLAFRDACREFFRLGTK